MSAAEEEDECLSVWERVERRAADLTFVKVDDWHAPIIPEPRPRTYPPSYYAGKIRDCQWTERRRIEQLKLDIVDLETSMKQLKTQFKAHKRDLRMRQF